MVKEAQPQHLDPEELQNVGGVSEISADVSSAWSGISGDH